MADSNSAATSAGQYLTIARREGERAQYAAAAMNAYEAAKYFRIALKLDSLQPAKGKE